MIVNTTITRSAELRFREHGIAREGEVGIGVGGFHIAHHTSTTTFSPPRLNPQPLELRGFHVFDVSRGTELREGEVGIGVGEFAYCSSY
jgi:hypothetical protein